MSALIYSLCALTSAGCAWLLLRRYADTRMRLLFWSGLCFVGLTINNVLLIFDRIVFPNVSLTLPRLVVSILSVGILLYALIWESE